MTDALQQNWLAQYEANRARLIEGGAYDPSSERDACGVGLVCAIDGKPRREIVEMAIKSLKAVAHRGAVDADGLSGDGAGVMIELPQAFFAAQVRAVGQTLRPGPIAVGQVFLPRTDLGAQDHARAIVEAEAIRSGFYIYGWRQTPMDLSVVGVRADATRPEIEQIMLAAPEGMEIEELERELFLCRRRIEKAVQASGLNGFYLCSLSARSIVWGIASQLAAQGAELAFTYLGEGLERRVRPLAESVGAKLLIPADVTDDASMDAAFAELEKEFGTIDFVVHSVAFANKDELKGSFVDNTTRDSFLLAMNISAFSFVDVAKRSARLMPNGGSMITL